MCVREAKRARRTVNEDLHLVLVSFVYPRNLWISSLVRIDHTTQPPIRGEAFTQSVHRHEEDDDADDDERGDHRRLFRDAVAGSHVRLAQFLKYLREHVSQIGPS